MCLCSGRTMLGLNISTPAPIHGHTATTGGRGVSAPRGQCYGVSVDWSGKAAHTHTWQNGKADLRGSGGGRDARREEDTGGGVQVKKYTCSPNTPQHTISPLSPLYFTPPPPTKSRLVTYYSVAGLDEGRGNKGEQTGKRVSEHSKQR